MIAFATKLRVLGNGSHEKNGQTAPDPIAAA